SGFVSKQPWWARSLHRFSSVDGKVERMYRAPPCPNRACCFTHFPAHALDVCCRARIRRAGSRLCSNLHLTAELDHSVRRNAEKFRRRQSVAMHGLEQFAADGSPARLSFRHDRNSAHEERRLHHVELKALCAAPLKHSRNIRVLHEPVISDHGMEIVAKVDDLDALVRSDPRNP